jgi:2-phospho-L-lactate/phosphoenolpyruvate guanylyltransferase
MDAIAVPHDPAPITATRSCMPKRLRRLHPADGPYTDAVPRPPAPASEWALPKAALGPSIVLIPVKAFHQAKRRLGTALPEQDRVQLVRSMATHVLNACAPLPVAVVCDDEEVARWASDLGAAVMWEPGQGLNGAVRAGVRRLGEAGTEWVTVAHGDLPRAQGLGALPTFDGITLVPDRRDDGTNVLRLPARATDFCFAYGPGSFRAHRAEAVRAGLAVRVVRNPDLAYDVDWPADVDELMRTTMPPADPAHPVP